MPGRTGGKRLFAARTGLSNPSLALPRKMTGSFRWGGGFCAHLDRSRQTGSRHSTIFAKNYSLYEKTNYCSCSRSTDACGFLILQAKRDSACCVVTGANHPVIKTVWDRTTRRPTSRSALSDARPAWAYGSPRHKRRLCFLRCLMLTYPHHGHIVPHRQGR